MRRTSIHVTLILAAMAAALTGCSRIPTAPNTEAALAPDNASVLIGHVDDPVPPVEAGDGRINTVVLGMGQAASLQAGRFTLMIHKNSLKVPATISMVQPNPDVMEVEFVVTPASANDFQVPLKLVADCSNESPDTVNGETVLWWDGAWTAAAKQTISNDGVTITAMSHTLTKAMLAPDDAGSGNKTH